MLKHERENLLSFTSDVNDSNTQESLFKKSAEGVSGHGCSYMPRVSQAKGWRNKEMFAQIDKIITAIDNAVWGLPLICLIMATGICLLYTSYADLLFNSFRHGIVCFSNIPLFPASLSHTILSRHILPVPITIETVD